MALPQSYLPGQREGRRSALTSGAGPQHSPAWTLNLPPSPFLCKGLGGCWQGSREQALYIPLREARRHPCPQDAGVHSTLGSSSCTLRAHAPPAGGCSQGHTHRDIPGLWLPRAALSKCFSFSLLSNLSPRGRTILQWSPQHW